MASGATSARVAATNGFRMLSPPVGISRPAAKACCNNSSRQFPSSLPSFWRLSGAAGALSHDGGKYLFPVHQNFLGSGDHGSLAVSGRTSGNRYRVSRLDRFASPANTPVQVIRSPHFSRPFLDFAVGVFRVEKQ